jgi:hypothetical protein
VSTCLDCHTLDSALRSLGDLLSTNGKELRKALKAFRPSAFRKMISGSLVRPDDILWNKIVGSSEPKPIAEVTFWFHATRVRPGTDFAEGIKPLNEMLPYLTSFLEELGRTMGIDSALSIPNSMNGSFQYVLKTTDAVHWGPYAFLVRDAILKKAPETHDYLSTPEIVEDLINAKFDSRLLDEFSKCTRPCIVKFSSHLPREDVAEVALYYCYAALWNQRQGFYTNTCFDGQGSAIAPAQIVGVEYFD